MDEQKMSDLENELYRMSEAYNLRIYSRTLMAAAKRIHDLEAKVSETNRERLEMDKMEITKEEYFQLKAAELELDMLNAGGVDNWEGRDDALWPDGEKSFADQKKELKKEILG